MHGGHCIRLHAVQAAHRCCLAALSRLVRWHAGSRALLAAGGRGGRGNASFKTGRNTAPAISEHGEAGASDWLDVELRLVADVGIVGAPNAGKSTLLSVVSAWRTLQGA